MASSGSFTTSSCEGRSITFNWSLASQSNVNDNSLINWNIVGSGSYSGWVQSGNFKVTINGNQVYYSSNRINLYSGTVIASGQCTIGHDNLGNGSFSAYVEAGIYYYAVNCSGSSSWSLPQIPRQATITSANNFTDESNPSFTFTNQAGFPMSVWLEPNPNGTHLCIRDNIPNTGSYTWTLTDDERNQLRQACTGKSCTCRIGLYTTINGTQYASYVDKTLTIVNANPTFTATYKDTNATTTAITSNNQQIIRNNSTLQVNLASCTALKYATISYASVTIAGMNFNTSTFTSGAATINVGTLNLSSNTTAAVTLVDSRGYSTIINLTLIILDWALPSGIITMARENYFYDLTNITVDGSISSLDSKNTMTIQYRYKLTTATDYGAYATLSDNVKSQFSVDNLHEWNVQVLISDKIGSTTYNLILPKGIPLVFYDVYLASVGINCFPRYKNEIEANGIGISENVLYNNTTGSTGTITLSETAANFTYLEIFFKNNDNNYNSVKVYQPNGKSIELQSSYPYENGYSFLKNTIVAISGTSITPTNYVEVQFYNNQATNTNVNYNYITRVVGYR